MTDLPSALQPLPVYFHGVDDTTPADCTMFTTSVLHILTTYVLRDGQIIGRIEHTQDMPGYAGSTLKGGTLIGFGEFTELAAKIAARPAPSTTS